MKTRTMSVTLSADRDAVFAFLSDLENLPRWAPLLCRTLRRDGRHWRARTPGGEDYIALLAEARTGVIDLLLGAQPDEMALLPLRVVGQSHGAAVTGALFQSPDWADELFEQYHAALLAGLRGLTTLYRGGEVHAVAQAGTSFHPNVVTAKFFETWDFYTTHLGFRTVAEQGDYVHLVHPEGAELGVLRHEVAAHHAELVSATEGRGVWFSLNVADADAEHARLVSAGVEVVEELADKPWGDRQFLVRDPNGVLIAIAHRLGTRSEATLAESVG